MPDDPKTSGTILAVGYALLSHKGGAGKLYDSLTIAAEIDPNTHRILDASITLLAEVGKRWIVGLMVGNDLTSEEDTQAFVDNIEQRLLGNTPRAVAHAYRDMVLRYLEHRGMVGRTGQM
jgi:hypothetical protein